MKLPEDNTVHEKSEKKSYSSPQLLVYGNVKDITQTANSNAGSNDGQNNKTNS